MTWLLWRQYRAQVAVFGVLFALFAVAAGVTGVHMAHVYADATHACSLANGCVVRGLFNGYGAIVDTVHLTIVVPVLLGAFVGAPLLAREAEQATTSLVWTQSVTRRHWLRAKLAAVFAGSVTLSAAVSLLVTWWSNTPNSMNGNRFEGAQFDTQNLAPIAFTLFAVALGLAAGALLRRTLPAVATTVVVYLAVRTAVSVFLRPHYLAASRVVTGTAGDTSTPSGSWTMTRALLDPSGHALSGRVTMPTACVSRATRDVLPSCLDRLGYRSVVTFQPASHYWPFQLIESAGFAGLAVILTVWAYRRTLHGDA